MPPQKHLSADAGFDCLDLETVDSTNAEGFRRAASLVRPLWIIAGTQTAGRGRRARPWTSPPGNFHGTLVLRLQEPPSRIALRSFVAALALHDALAAVIGTSGTLSLKWPNDLLLEDRKVSGILLEASAGLLCIGIGINLEAAPPPEAVEPGAVPPVSVRAVCGAAPSPQAVLERLAPAYLRREAQFQAEGFGSIRADWLARAARLGKRIVARTGSDVREGVFETIDSDGNLVLRMACGTVAVPAADVFF